MKLYEIVNTEGAKHKKWFKVLKKYGEVFFVGGAVRDELIGKQSKDIDLVIRKIPFDKLVKLLKPFGKVVKNEVGGKQVVIKFYPKNEDTDYDIALPRTETKSSAGHKGFDVTTDPNLDIVKDLARRDFTINAISKDHSGNVVDPFGGQEDIKKKIIRVISEDSFKEDPLRMLRAVQFASRFGFTIEPKTLKLIKQNASKIKEISGERIIMELEKIVSKGDPRIAAKLLDKTGLFDQIFGRKYKGKLSDISKNLNIAEFISLLLEGYSDADSVYLRQLRGKKPIAKEIAAYSMALNSNPKNDLEARLIASHMYSLSPQSLSSSIIPSKIARAGKDITGRYPSGISDLKIDGKDLQNLGFHGKEIGQKLRASLEAVYADQIPNKKKDLLDFVEK